MAPRVSVIIPTRNNEATLEDLLDSIRNQTISDIQVIVADSESTDNTCRIAEKFGAKVVNVPGERTTAKNKGLELAEGRFVLFLDSDMTLEPSVIEECTYMIELCNGLVIPEQSVGKGIWVKIRDFERSMYQGSVIESPRFFKRADARRVDGFDEDVIFYEESTLPQKIGGPFLHIQSTIFHNENNFNIKRWVAKKQYYHETVTRYADRYPEYARLQFSISYRVKLYLQHWKQLLRHPVLATGVFVLKALEYVYSKRAKQLVEPTQKAVPLSQVETVKQ